LSPGAPAVHADGDARRRQHAREIEAGELAALIGIEDLRLAVLAQRLFEHLDAERRLHRDRDAMGEHAPAKTSITAAR
jgi:hypothetical protein